MSTAFTSGVPGVFAPTMTAFPSRHLFHVADRAENGSVTGNSTFTQEDRLMLQLLYQQQQTIQIQLHSMALSIQQLHMTIAGFHKTLPSVAKCDESESNANSCMGAAPCAPVQGQSSVPSETVVTGRPSSQNEKANGRRPGSSATERNPVQVWHAEEASRSCTPPPEDSDVSRQSAMNRSTESAAPWDPSAGSRHSSVIGGARGDNPLLSSLRGKLPTPGRSATTSASVGAGFPASANASMFLDESRLTLRPQARHTSTSASQVDQESHNASSVPPSSNAPQQQRQQRIVLDNRKVGTTRTSLSGCGGASGTCGASSTIAPVDVPSALDSVGDDLFHTQGWGYAPANANQRGREDFGETSNSAIGYDSQSDGYGSYETRQYLKSVGIL
ncbi:hypothetical protein ERJ75_000969200 [Trypanosoma vivax]|uniref:Uncharacterized protein n=1 Tax=Trypanosoma vivax (strain Y486) TaxID=1055687 RepID=G0U6D7_TRYVY|nr:hypothetical protein ERJ75_000969200 [Trypanosoma vivax]CCC51441.1 conserved hypothetical protein [Trypanosoma vivax Y486]